MAGRTHSRLMSPSFTKHGFRFAAAEPRHNPEIARLLNDNAIPGWVTLSYETQQGFHSSLWNKMLSQTIIGEDPDTGQLGGLASRSRMPSFLNGQSAAISWMGQLRVDKNYRNRAHLLQSGFEAIRALGSESDSAQPWSLASIIEENFIARRIMEAGLKGFPSFTYLFDYHVLALPVYRPAKTPPSHIRRARAEDMPRIAGFLQTMNQARDLSPRLSAKPNFTENWTGLEAEDFLIHSDGETINAVAAVWDTSPYRALRVKDYKPVLKTLRPVVNFFAPLSGLPILPKHGTTLNQAYLSLWAVRGDNFEIWRDMITSAKALAKTKGAQILALGFCETDPLLKPTEQAFKHRPYKSRIYCVSWPDEITPFIAPKFSKPKIEIGLL